MLQSEMPPPSPAKKQGPFVQNDTPYHAFSSTASLPVARRWRWSTRKTGDADQCGIRLFSKNELQNDGLTDSAW